MGREPLLKEWQPGGLNISSIEMRDLSGAGRARTDDDRIMSSGL